MRTATGRITSIGVIAGGWCATVEGAVPLDIPRSGSAPDRPPAVGDVVRYEPPTPALFVGLVERAKDGAA